MKKIVAFGLCFSALGLGGCAVEAGAEDEALGETEEELLASQNCELVNNSTALKCWKDSTKTQTITHALLTKSTDFYDFGSSVTDPGKRIPGGALNYISSKGSDASSILNAPKYWFSVYGGFADDPGAVALLQKSLDKLPNSHLRNAHSIFGRLPVDEIEEPSVGAFVIADKIAKNAGTTSGGATIPHNATNISWQALHRDGKILGLDHSITLLHELGHTFMGSQSARKKAPVTICASSANPLPATCVTSAEQTLLESYKGPSITKITVNGAKVPVTLAQDINGCPTHPIETERGQCGRAERLCDLYESHARGKLAAKCAGAPNSVECKLAPVAARIFKAL